jgi:hypothetical protein
MLDGPKCDSRLVKMCSTHQFRFACDAVAPRQLFITASANARESCFQEALNNWAMGTLGEGLSPFKRNASVQP